MVYFCDVGSGWVCTNAWCKMENFSAKLKTGMCEMKILGSEVLWCIFGAFVQDGLAPMRGVTWRTCPAKFKTGMCEMKILGSEVLWCIIGALVQDRLAPMRSVRWRTCLAKFKTGMCEMKILGSEMV